MEALLPREGHEALPAVLGPAQTHRLVELGLTRRQRRVVHRQLLSWLIGTVDGTGLDKSVYVLLGEFKSASYGEAPREERARGDTGIFSVVFKEATVLAMCNVRDGHVHLYYTRIYTLRHLCKTTEATSGRRAIFRPHLVHLPLTPSPLAPFLHVCDILVVPFLTVGDGASRGKRYADLSVPYGSRRRTVGAAAVRQ